jgi:hypothetical protein
MPHIRSLKANVTREEAIRQFSPTGPIAAFRNAAFGHLRAVAALYIPFRLFRVEIVNRGVPEERLVAIDAVSGMLDLYQFDHLPEAGETIMVETGNSPPADLQNNLATELVVAKLRRVLYSRGFFHMRDLRIAAVPLPAEIHIPYWLGFRGPDHHARLSVIDAVRRRFEGAKVRKLVEAWLIAGTEADAPGSAFPV